MPCTVVSTLYKLPHLIINYPYRTGIVLTSISLRRIDTEWSSSKPKGKCSEAPVPHQAPCSEGAPTAVPANSSQQPLIWRKALSSQEPLLPVSEVTLGWTGTPRTREYPTAND